MKTPEQLVTLALEIAEADERIRAATIEGLARFITLDRAAQAALWATFDRRAKAQLVSWHANRKGQIVDVDAAILHFDRTYGA